MEREDFLRNKEAVAQRGISPVLYSFLCSYSHSNGKHAGALSAFAKSPRTSPSTHVSAVTSQHTHMPRNVMPVRISAVVVSTGGTASTDTGRGSLRAWLGPSLVKCWVRDGVPCDPPRRRQRPGEKEGDDAAVMGFGSAPFRVQRDMGAGGRAIAALWFGPRRVACASTPAKRARRESGRPGSGTVRARRTCNRSKRPGSPARDRPIELLGALGAAVCLRPPRGEGGGRPARLRHAKCVLPVA